jgi:hypothetical protein
MSGPSDGGHRYDNITLGGQVKATLGDTYNNYQINSKTAQGKLIMRGREVISDD